jgi:High potential iron-sulfur protein
MNATVKLSRRAILRNSVTLLATFGALPIVMLSRSAKAGTAMKSDLNYQDHPKNGKRCVNCSAFIAGDAGKGACRIVQGEVTPDGWCMAYSERK